MHVLHVRGSCCMHDTFACQIRSSDGCSNLSLLARYSGKSDALGYQLCITMIKLGLNDARFAIDSVRIAAEMRD